MTITEELLTDYPESVRVAGIKVRNRGETKKIGALDEALHPGDYVMLDIDGEPTYGVVHTEPQSHPFIPPMRLMKTILRKATEEERRAIERNERLAEEGLRYCRERAAALGLSLKLVEVYCAWARREMRFIYTSPDRVDFRQLVRDLARRFGGRIEMRQVGEREEAKLLGGVDSCGLVLCCAAFMTDFKPVTVRHAKAQGLPMDESRLIGVCGRLKCCLMFELEEPQTARSGKGSSAALINPARLAPSPSQPRRHGN